MFEQKWRESWLFMKVFDVDFIINILRFLEIFSKSHPEIVSFY